MKRFCVVKIFFLLTFLFGLSSCKNIIVRAGGFGALNTNDISDIDEATPKTWSVSALSLTTKADEKNVMAGRDTNKDILTEKDVHFAVWVGQSALVPAENRLQNYGELNLNRRKPRLSGQAWIICKPQFTRVRSEGFFKEKTHIETLF